MPTQQVDSTMDPGCESPAAVRPLAFGPVGFFLRVWRHGVRACRHLQAQKSPVAAGLLRGRNDVEESIR